MKPIIKLISDMSNLLRERGVELSAPASRQLIDRLQEFTGGELSDGVRILYHTFDGFPENAIDEPTLIRIWPIEEVISNPSNLKYAAGRIYFADYFWGADSISCNMLDDESDLRWKDYKTQAAINFFEFCEKVGRGSFAP